MTNPESVLVDVDRATRLGQTGDRRAARYLLADLWRSVGDDGDALHRCAIAHAMADVHDDDHEVLLWDSRALEAASAVTDDRAAAAGMTGGVAIMYPSLHLNMADVLRRLGATEEATQHVRSGREALEAVDDGTGYWATIREALERVSASLPG